MEPLPIVIAAEAETDLVEIWAYLAERSPRRAQHLLQEIQHQCQLLAQMPEMGRKREELAPGLRSFVVGRYVILYRIQINYLEIVRVVSGYRDLDALF